MRTLKESKWFSATRPRNAMEIQVPVQRPSKSMERFPLNAETCGSQVPQGKSRRRHFWLFFKATKTVEEQSAVKRGHNHGLNSALAQPGDEVAGASQPSSFNFYVFIKTELVALKCNQSYSPSNNLVTTDKITSFQKIGHKRLLQQTQQMTQEQWVLPLSAVLK